jgi:hypothetical protein
LFITKNKSFLVFIATYALISCIDVWLFSSLVQSNDSFQYLSIAENYSNGNWFDAVSGYWSPLLSWLSAPFVQYFKNKILILKLLNKAVGVIGLLVGIKWIEEFTTTNNYKIVRVIVYLIWILLLTIYSHTETADFLSANLLLGLTFLVFKIGKPTIVKAIVVGVLAALTYFAKYYNFWFVQWLLLVFLLIIFKDTPKQFVKFYLLQLVVFLVLSGGWVYVMHRKFGLWRVEYVSRLNKAIFGPDNCNINYIESEMINPLLKMGLIKPLPNQLTINGDDPRVYYKIKEWNMFANQHIERTKSIFIKNFKSVYYDFVFRYLLFFTLLLILFYFLKCRDSLNIKSIIFWFVSFFYIVGYLVIFYAPRYAYYNHFITFIFFASMGLVCLHTNWGKIIFYFGLIILLRNVFILYKNDWHQLQHQKPILSAINQLKQLNIKGNTCFIGNINYENAVKLNEVSFDYLMINYYLKNIQCGVLDINTINQSDINRIKELNINFLFLDRIPTKQLLQKLGHRNYMVLRSNGLTLVND